MPFRPRIAQERSWRRVTARYERRCPKCSRLTADRRCPTDGTISSWGFVVEAGRRSGKRRRIMRRGYSTKREAQAAALALEIELDGAGPIQPTTISVGQ